jgi:glycosyltransferase involved in cell wall biosynthesis
MERLLTTLPHEFAALTPARLRWWRQRADVVNRREHSRVGYLQAVIRASSRYDAVLLDGSVGARELYSDLFIAAAIRRRTRRVVISDATWKLGGSLDRVAMTAGLRAVDSPRTIYCVLSSEETDTFPRTWRVDPSRVVFTPFCYTLTEEDLAAPTSDDGGIFAGGDSMRDYGTLLEAAAALPARVTIASATLRAGEVPPGVLARSVGHAEFNRLLRAASVVVVPLRAAERSAGQQTYLNAMAIGKLVVVTDTPGVRDYVEDGVTGLVVPPRDPHALASALSWALDPRNATEAAAIATRARDAARTTFSPDAYFQRVVDVAMGGVE